MDALTPHIESLIFAADRAVSVEDIHECLEATFESLIPVQDIMMAIESLAHRYQHHDYSFELIEIAGGWQFMTKPAFHASVHTYLRQNANKRLSAAAMETLAIIAYKQPVTKPEMEAIRGVSCDYSIQKLLEKELVAIVGRSEAVGKPLLYGTSEKFMDYFGLKSMKDLPKLRDFKLPEEEIGQSPPIEEVVDQLYSGQRAIAEMDGTLGIQLQPPASLIVNPKSESE